MNTPKSDKPPVTPSRPQAPTATSRRASSTETQPRIFNDAIQSTVGANLPAQSEAATAAGTMATTNAKKRKANGADFEIVFTKTGHAIVNPHPTLKNISDSVPRPVAQPPLPKVFAVSNNRPVILAAPPSIVAPPGSLDAQGNLRRRTIDFQEWGTDMVTLSVTDHNGLHSFPIHKNLACYHSEVSRDKFNIQSQSQNMELNDTIKATASALVRYMYKDILWAMPNSLPSKVTLVALWILGAKLRLPVLQNASIMAIEQCNKMDKIVPTECLLSIYKSTKSGDPLRRLLVDYITDWAVEDFEKEVAKEPTRYSPETLQNIAIASMRKRSGPKIQRNMYAFLVPVPEIEAMSKS